MPTDLAKVEKKLREAKFFLGSMRSDENKWPSGDCEEEPFTFHLSAFLGAAWSVSERLFAVQRAFSDKDAFYKWHDAWRDALPAREQAIYKHLELDRNKEVHGRGSNRTAKGETVSLSDLTLHQPGTWQFFGVPPEVPDLTFQRSRFGFTIDGTWIKATDACAEYLDLLGKMVAKFHADHP